MDAEVLLGLAKRDSTATRSSLGVSRNMIGTSAQHVPADGNCAVTDPASFG